MIAIAYYKFTMNQARCQEGNSPKRKFWGNFLETMNFRRVGRVMKQIYLFCLFTYSYFIGGIGVSAKWVKTRRFLDFFIIRQRNNFMRFRVVFLRIPLLWRGLFYAAKWRGGCPARQRPPAGDHPGTLLRKVPPLQRRGMGKISAWFVRGDQWQYAS